MKKFGSCRVCFCLLPRGAVGAAGAVAGLRRNIAEYHNGAETPSPVTLVKIVREAKDQALDYVRVVTESQRAREVLTPPLGFVGERCK